MLLPIDSIIILGNNLAAKVIKKIIDLSEELATRCTIIDSLDRLNELKTSHWGEGRNLVITTEVTTQSQAISISQSLYCKHKFWGALLILLDRGFENKLTSCSFVGINGELLYGSEVAKKFGHGLLKADQRDIYRLVTSLLIALPDLNPITSDQFEKFLSQSEIGNLRELYKQNILEQKSTINSKSLQSILQHLSEWEREKWDFSVHHHNVDWAMNEVRYLYNLCQASQQIDLERIKSFLSKTYAGVPNV
jgi:hypothetical protein